MSRRNSTIVKNSAFIRRFTEVCGTSQPAEVARLLNISYQAANNYLNGRIPDVKVLLEISERTAYSLHWLLTGEGKKIIETKLHLNTPLLSDEMRAFVREICTEVISEIAVDQKAALQPKTLVLTPDRIRSEKVLTEAKTASDPKK